MYIWFYTLTWILSNPKDSFIFNDLHASKILSSVKEFSGSFFISFGDVSFKFCITFWNFWCKILPNCYKKFVKCFSNSFCISYFYIVDYYFFGNRVLCTSLFPSNVFHYLPCFLCQLQKNLIHTDSIHVTRQHDFIKAFFKSWQFNHKGSMFLCRGF